MMPPLCLSKACTQALKPGGRISISVADRAYVVSLYGLVRKSEISEDCFFVEEKESHLARHEHMHCFYLVEVTLEQTGFSGLTRYGYQQGEPLDIELLDVYPEMPLFVEAVRSDSNE